MSDWTTPAVGPADAATMMRYDANKKSALIAYLLWFFVGWLGGHRFYLGRVGSALVMLLLTAVSTVLSIILIGYVGYFMVGVWLLLDAFLIPGMVRRYNNRLIARLSR